MPDESTTMKALKEAIGYFERHARTEDTLELRRLLRAAMAEQAEREAAYG